MNIVIAMAGRGSRFTESGETTPKPLINVFGDPMFVWALKSIPLHLAKRLIFLCLQEHLDEWSLEHEIRSRYAPYNPLVIPVSQVTEGQACTILLAQEYINNQEGLIVYNADTFFSSSLEDKLKDMDPETMGIISVFEATEERWSFAKVNKDGHVVEVAEKKPISKWATAGMYYFRHGCDFVSATNGMIRQDLRVNGEFYVGPLYNILVRDGKKVIIDIIDEMWCLGTPEELRYFLKCYQGDTC